MKLPINVVAAVIKKDDLFFIAQRNKNKYFGLKWEFPGGKVQSYESYKNALKREIKEELKINPEHRSCHTGVSSQGHFFEGHIPSEYVSQFLSEGNPDAIGLSVPGMPLGSPGMEVEDRFTPYDVLVHLKDGSTKVYAEIRK